MFTYNETSQMQQRYNDVNKRAPQTEGWTHACPNAIDRAMMSLKAAFTRKPAQPERPAVHKPAGAH